jgi:hypothetical protein
MHSRVIAVERIVMLGVHQLDQCVKLSAWFC